MGEEKKTGLDLLREPFPANLISKLPKPTCKAEEWNRLPKGTCHECGGYHATSRTIHLDYVGHAALTDRLLDADPNWSWEPMALKDGLPAFDSSGGLWIKLTVCGVTRIGYGHAKANQYAEIGSREKEVIGDALRNSAMRFGAALDLWHKGDLHQEEADDSPPQGNRQPSAGNEPPASSPARPKVCPGCGSGAAIYTDKKKENGFYCFKAKGGCGKNWVVGDNQPAAPAEETDNPFSEPEFSNVFIGCVKQKKNVDPASCHECDDAKTCKQFIKWQLSKETGG